MSTPSPLTPTPVSYTPPRPRSLRRRASDILSRPGIRMGMILASLLFFTLWVNIIYLPELAWYAIDWISLHEQSVSLYLVLDALVYLCDALLILLLGVPVLYGWIRYMQLCSTGVLPPYSVIFSAFSDRRHYLHALGLTLLVLLRLIAPLAVFGGLLWVAQLALQLASPFGYAAMAFFAIAAGLSLILGTLLNSGLSLVFLLDVNHPEATVAALFRSASTMLRGKRGDLWLLALSSLPSFIAGVLTLGIFLVLHAIPHHTILMVQALQSLCGEHLPVVEIAAPTTSEQSSIT